MLQFAQNERTDKIQSQGCITRNKQERRTSSRSSQGLLLSRAKHEDDIQQQLPVEENVFERNSKSTGFSLASIRLGQDSRQSREHLIPGWISPANLPIIWPVQAKSTHEQTLQVAPCFSAQIDMMRQSGGQMLPRQLYPLMVLGRLAIASPVTGKEGSVLVGPMEPSAGQVQRICESWIEERKEYSPRLQQKGSSGSMLMWPALTLNIHEAALMGVTGAGGSLPYREAIQRSFGGRHDISRLVTHVDGAAVRATQAMGARAFTRGDHIAFNTPPDLHTTAHEAAHAIQQRAGIRLPGGFGEVGDRYERHADAVAARVVAGQSSEALLDEIEGAQRPLAMMNESVGTEVQRAVPLPSLPDDEIARNASQQIVEARRTLADPNLDPIDQEAIQARIAAAEASLRDYRRTRQTGGPTATLASTTTGNPASAVLALFALVTALIFAQAISQTPAQQRAAQQLARDLSNLASALEIIVLMTAAGNVIHPHIRDEARRRAIAAGLAATAATVTNEMLCQMLEQMARETRRTDTDKWKKIISTMKGLGCRPSRASR